MQGKITIEAVDGYRNLTIKAEMRDISWIDKVVIMDALAMALDLDKLDRKNIGLTIALGGLGAVTGVAPTTVKIDEDLINKLRKRGTDHADV